MEYVSETTLDTFERITKYDIKEYFQSFIDFVGEGGISIYNYYGGLNDVYPTESFNELIKLQKLSVNVVEMFKANDHIFSTYEYWVLLEMVEDSIGRLDTISNYSRWLRSPINEGLYGSSIEMDYVMRGGQTLEELSDQVQGSEESQDEWVDLAIRNNLIEEDYTPEGGAILKVKFNNTGIFMNAVVDNIDSLQKTYGLDVDRVLTYEYQDLKILGYKETIEQSAEILAGLRKGDNPFHENDGIDEKTIIGNTLASISYPIIFRQLITTFSKDDTFTSLSLVNITKSNDGVYFEFNIETKGGEVLTEGILVK